MTPGFEYRFFNVAGDTAQQFINELGKDGWRVTVLNSRPGAHTEVHVLMERAFMPKQPAFVDAPTDAPATGAMKMGG